MHKSIYLSIVVVSVILGLMMSVQFRFNNAAETGAPYGRDREQQLAVERRQLVRERELLREEAADLQAKIDEAGKGDFEANLAMNSEYYKIRGYAGFSPLAGPGVEVFLGEQAGEDRRLGADSVRDTDLLKIINDLRGAGAEAIAVNEQRILATSEVREAGRHINVNLVRLAPPYKVTAIGNATMLKSSLEIKYGIIEDLQGKGVLVNVEEKEDVFVPAFNGALRFDYAKPTQGGG